MQCGGMPCGMHGSIAGLQEATLGSWSRKCCNGTVVSAAKDATLCHGFVNVLSSEMSRLLQASGAGGIFMTPKSKDASGPSAKFKVVCRHLRH